MSRRLRAIRAAAAGLSARESDLTAKIREHCEGLGLVLNRADPGRGRLRAWQAGMPDYWLTLPGGQACVIEAKAPHARPQRHEPKQNAVLADLRARGACVIVARSLEDVAQVLNIVTIGRLRAAWEHGERLHLDSPPPPALAPEPRRRKPEPPRLGRAQNELFG